MRSLPSLVLVVTVAAGVLCIPTDAADDVSTEGLDYEFFKERISPIIHRVCAECHANPRKRLGKHFLRPAPGRRIRERHHKANFETIARYIEAGNPAASTWLLKPIGPSQGGITHEGGVQIRQNSPEYGAMVDFINGTKLPPKKYVPPESDAGQPDFRFFFHRIEPVLLRVCSECHEGRGKGKFKLITHAGDEFPLEDHYKNFETVLELLRPGQPERSRFLQKPLAAEDGGLKHRGGDRIRKGDDNYENWVAFIGGERGPPLPSEVDDTPVRITTAGVTIQAEDFGREGDVRLVEDAEAEGFHRVVAGKEGGVLLFNLSVAEGANYRVLLRARTDGGGVKIRFGEADPSTVAVEPSDPPAFVEVGPRHLVDEKRPLFDPRGDIALAAQGVMLDGRRSGAAFLVEPGVRHRGAAAHFWMPHEEEGGDDALLLFDMIDSDNGKFVGLTDGGRRFVIGLLERGKRRVLGATRAPEQRGEGPRVVMVDTFGGVAIGHLDGRPLVFMNLGNRLGKGLFGAASHGLVEVARLAAMEEYEVYVCQFDVAPVVYLPPGPQLLRIELPPGSASLDAIRFLSAGP